MKPYDRYTIGELERLLRQFNPNHEVHFDLGNDTAYILKDVETCDEAVIIYIQEAGTQGSE
jgi:hypothetical protein